MPRLACPTPAPTLCNRVTPHTPSHSPRHTIAPSPGHGIIVSRSPQAAIRARTQVNTYSAEREADSRIECAYVAVLFAGISSSRLAEAEIAYSQSATR